MTDLRSHSTHLVAVYLSAHSHSQEIVDCVELGVLEGSLLPVKPAVSDLLDLDQQGLNCDLAGHSASFDGQLAAVIFLP